MNMNKLIAIVMTTMLFFVSQSFVQQAAQSKFAEIKIKVSAQCETCKETIEKALAYEPGVKSSNLDLKTMYVTVVYNPKKTNPDKIRKAISMAGYDADNIPADEEAYHKLPKCCKKGGHQHQ